MRTYRKRNGILRVKDFHHKRRPDDDTVMAGTVPLPYPSPSPNLPLTCTRITHCPNFI